MPKDARQVGNGLQRKGFTSRQGDHTYFHFCVNGKKTKIYTKISHGENEIGDRLLGMMARQLRLSKRDFLELVDCPLSLDEYQRVLRQGGHIEAESPAVDSNSSKEKNANP